MKKTLFDKRIYMAGCGGMLGDAFFEVFNKNNDIKCTDIDLNDKWLSYCDFRNYDEYMDDVKKFRPNYLFHLGAFTDLEYCEKNSEQTYATNTNSVKNAVSIANKLSIPILYISTAGIFDGKKDFYDERDTPNPMGIYAKSKYDGERYVIEHADKYYICRAGWMMGGKDKDKKFVKKIIDQLRQGVSELFLVNDKLGTPTYTIDFANNVNNLIANGNNGLFNMVCQGDTSRLEVGKYIIDYFGLSKNVKIIEVDSDYFKKTYFAPRPASEILINRNLNLINMDHMRDWKTSLKEYLDGWDVEL